MYIFLHKLGLSKNVQVKFELSFFLKFFLTICEGVHTDCPRNMGRWWEKAVSFNCTL